MGKQDHPKEVHLRFLIGRRMALREMQKIIKDPSIFHIDMFVQAIAAVYRWEQLGDLPDTDQLMRTLHYSITTLKNHLKSAVEKEYIRERLSYNPLRKIKGKRAKVYEVTEKGQKLINQFIDFVEHYAI